MRASFQIFVIVVALLGLSLGARADTSANQIATAVENNVDLLEFITQAKLSPDERAQVAREVAVSMSKLPQNVIRRDGLIVTTLANAARHPKDAPRLRELWRFDIAANVPHDDIEYILTEKYDPVVVFDKPHQRIISQGTLVALRNCTVWLTQNLHKPAPDQSFLASERNLFRSSYARLSDDEQDAFAHVGRNCPRAVDFFNGVVAAKRVQFFSQNAKEVSNTTIAATDAALISRIAYNIVVRRAGGGTAMQGRVFDYMVQQSLLQQQLQRSVFRNPPLPPPN
jgi:hypothetical protein